MSAHGGLVRAAGRPGRQGGRWVQVIASLAVGVWLADVVEMVKLAGVTVTWSTYAPSEARIVSLPVATWPKWLGLGLVLALLRQAQGGWRQVVLTLPVVLGLAAFMYPTWLAEGVALSVAVAFVVLIVDAIGAGEFPSTVFGGLVGFHHDSVRGERVGLPLDEVRPGHWRLRSATRSHRCWSDRGHRHVSTVPWS